MIARPDSRWRIPAVRYLLGLLLLASAGLKLFGMRLSPVPEMGWVSSPRVQLAALQWELVVAGWLLSGYGQRGAWIAATGTFLVFAAVSGYLGWVGELSCGCLGPIRTRPWHLFAVDAAALAVLPFARPNLGSLFRDRRGTWQRLAWPAALAAALPAGVLGGAYAAFGSIEGGVSWLRGETLSVSTRLVDFGEVAPGEARQASVAVRNRSGRPVHLLGGTQTALWSVTSTLPLTVPPGETREVIVSLNVPAWKSGIVTNSVDLLTDDAAQRVIRLGVTCRVK